jgi:hypothetical protein
MHGWCFHFEYEHSGGPDAACGVHCPQWEFQQLLRLAAERGIPVASDLPERARDLYRHLGREHPGDPDMPCGEACALAQFERLRGRAAESGIDVNACLDAARETVWKRADIPSETPRLRPCPACGKPVPPPGGRCPHCRAWRPDVARDRALYHGFTALTLVLAVTRWVTSTPVGLPLFRPGLWREFLHPLVTVPLALAIVFAFRVARKTAPPRRKERADGDLP